MKKLLITLLILVTLILVAGGAIYYLISRTYDGVPYYVKITEVGTKIQEGPYYDYIYNLPAYNEKGEAYKKDGNELVEFRGNKDRPLKMNAILRLTINDTKGVTSWEEVELKDVPQVVKDILEKQLPEATSATAAETSAAA